MQRLKWMRKLGWRLFMVMWIPFALIFLGMIGLPSGSYSWNELPVLSRVGIIGAGALMISSTVLLIGATVLGSRMNAEIQEHGVPALAKVLEIHDTGTTINENPVVRLVLEVQPDHAPPFLAETERLIPRLQVPEVQPGEVVMVKYDPESGEVSLGAE